MESMATNKPQDHRPLLSHVSIDASTVSSARPEESISKCYGATDQSGPDNILPLSALHVSYDVGNHAHPYSDAVLGGSINSGIGGSAQAHCLGQLRELQVAESKVSYWSVMKDNGNFRWYLMSYLVTHAGE